MESPWKSYFSMDDLGYPYFREPPHVYIRMLCEYMCMWYVYSKRSSDLHTRVLDPGSEGLHPWYVHAREDLVNIVEGPQGSGTILAASKVGTPLKLWPASVQVVCSHMTFSSPNISSWSTVRSKKMRSEHSHDYWMWIHRGYRSTWRSFHIQFEWGGYLGALESWRTRMKLWEGVFGTHNVNMHCV